MPRENAYKISKLVNLQNGPPGQGPMPQRRVPQSGVEPWCQGPNLFSIQFDFAQMTPDIAP